MQVATLYRWLWRILVVSTFWCMSSAAFSEESKPTPMGEVRTSRWKVVITERHEMFPVSKPGYSFGGSKTEDHYQALFNLTLKKSSSHRWSGRAVGSGSANRICQAGPDASWGEDLDWTYRKEECNGYGPLETTANIIIDDFIELDDDSMPTKINLLLKSDARQENSIFNTKTCRYTNITLPGSPASKTYSWTRDFRGIGCEYLPSTSTRNVPFQEGTYEAYRDVDKDSEVVITVQLIRLSGGCLDNCTTHSPCLKTRCHEIFGCITEGIEGICQPVNKCMLGKCNSFLGLCLEIDPISCSGGDVCNAFYCDPAIGCLSRPMPDGTPCPGSGDNRCRPKPTCISGSCSPSPPLNGLFDFDPHDCYKNECTNGYEALIPDDTEIPPQASPHVLCEKQVCVGGSVQIVADVTEILPQVPHNCRREVCGPYGVEYREDNTDEPLQESSHDCLRQVCQRGEPISVPDDSETPLPSEDGRRRVCQGGEAVVVEE